MMVFSAQNIFWHEALISVENPLQSFSSFAIEPLALSMSHHSKALMLDLRFFMNVSKPVLYLSFHVIMLL
jgi:hypothetical protein